MNIEIKSKIVETLKTERERYESANKMATALGINPAQLSRILNGELDGVLSDANWISIAHKFGVIFGNQKAWKTIETETYNYIYKQLQICKDKSVSGIFCDIADIGKTYTAKAFVKNNKNAVYIDCSQYKTRQRLIRAIAREFGINHGSRYSDVFGELTYYLCSIERPLIILDEAGDLEYSAFLELKALWNATEYVCGWYMLGADGLKPKIEAGINRFTIGYTEIMSRYGTKINRVSPIGADAMNEWRNTQVALIARGNNEHVDLKDIVAKSNGSLRRVRIILSQYNS